MINISSVTPNLNTAQLLEGLEVPAGLIRPEDMPALSEAVRDSLSQTLTSNGFPSEARLSISELMARDNSDVWDAHVSYMASHPDDNPTTPAELDAAVAQLAENPDADAASLDALVATMNGGGIDVGDPQSLKDALGTGVMVSFNGRVDALIDRLGESIRDLGGISKDNLTELIDTSGRDVDAEHLDQGMAQQVQMLDTINGLVEEFHEATGHVIDNIHSDAGGLVEGDATVAMAEANVEVVEGVPDSEVFDADSDDVRDDTYDDTHNDTIA
jgi:hypothetical protein